MNLGGSPHLTGFINVKQLYALIHSWDVAQPKVYDVTVDNGSSDGGLSNAVQLTVTAGPIISGLSPSAAAAGAPEFALTISGSNFVQTDTVQWNGSKLPTTFVSSTQLTVAVPATDTAQAGTATVTVVTSDGALSNPLSFSITPPPLAVSLSSFPKGILGTPYSVTLKASNGTPPFSWSISVGVLPAGLTLDSSSGLVSGTPTATGNFTFTVRVSDQSQQTASQSFSVTIGAPVAPPASISGIGDTIEPGQQPGVGVSLASPYSLPITGQMTLTFTSDAIAPSDDPAIQFSSGGRTASFTIPANGSQATFGGASTIGFQTGTVAGTIHLTVTMQSGGTDVTPTPFPNRSVTISRMTPIIDSVVIASRIASGFEVRVTGYSTPREVTQATFTFNPAPGKNLQTTTLSIANAGSAFASWFENQTSEQHGSRFLLTVPFTVQGNVTDIGSVSVTLTNSVGISQPAPANL